jgi:hypothetical protein
LRRNGLLRGNRHAQVGVILLPVAYLGLDATGPGRPAAATALVIPMICVPVRWHVGFIGPVNSHWTSRPSRDAGNDKKRVIHYDK